MDNKQWSDLYSAYIALFWAAPYIAWRMEHTGLFSEEKTTILREVEDYIVKNELVIHSSAHEFLDDIDELYMIRYPDKPFKDLLFNPSSSDIPTLRELLVNRFHLLSPENAGTKKKRYSFRHQHFRDFLSALHIDNALKIAFVTSDRTGNFIIPEEIRNRVLPVYITDMLGGYYEDYQNQKQVIVKNNLHKLLDCLRGLDPTQVGFAVNNVIGVWRTSRVGHIVGEDLSNLNLTKVPMNGIFFSTPIVATCFNKSFFSDATFLPQGHSEEIESAVYSPDGSCILTASRDGTVREWDRKTGACLHTYKGHTDFVNSATYSSDGQRILSASGDGTVREWDRKTGADIHTYKGHTRAVRSAVYSPDGSCILTASRDGTVREWDRKTGADIHTYRGLNNWMMSAVYSPDGSCILTGSWGCEIREWDRKTGVCLHTYKERSPVESAVYSPDGSYILTTAGNTVVEWDRKTGADIHTYKERSPVESAVYSPDGSYILTTAGNTVVEWDRKTGADIHTYKGHNTWSMESAVYSPDGSCILTASRDGTVVEWDRKTKFCLHIFKKPVSWVESAVYSYDGSCILTASIDGTVREWDRKTGACLHTYKGHTHAVRSAVYSSDGSCILTASIDGTVSILRVKFFVNRTEN